MRQRRPPRPEYLRLVEPGAIIPPPGRPRRPVAPPPAPAPAATGGPWAVVGFVAGVAVAAILIAVVEAFR